LFKIQLLINSFLNKELCIFKVSDKPKSGKVTKSGKATRCTLGPVYQRTKLQQETRLGNLISPSAGLCLQNNEQMGFLIQQAKIKK
jgi:hypothetical protein